MTHALPLLSCDVWKHACCLDYRNRRPDFVKALIEELINGDFVAENLARHDGTAAA